MAGQLVHFFFQAVDCEVDSAWRSGSLWAKLRGESLDGFAALLVLIGDIHNERGTHVGIGNGVKNFKRAVSFAGDRQLFEAGEEAAFVAQSGGLVMVRMAGFPVG